MDAVVARRMAAELVNSEIGGWKVTEYVNCGKSAIVLRGWRDENVAALKVFDPDLVQRFGRGSQLARIDREKTLIGKNHPNLVSIFDGGECPQTGYLFVAMEYIEAPNLAAALQMLPRDGIRSVISQVAAAAEFLESLNLAHRDIKPENIVITQSWARTVLLDLGVLRPLSGSDLTDETNAKPFIGTLRYASPEHLLRENDESSSSWRALTFYQIGAVLHDLIMRRPLFAEYSEPYGRLVHAVLRTVPTLDATDVDPELISLAKDCLVKSPEHRLRFVTWERFQFRPGSTSALSQAREKLAKRRAQSSSYRPTELTEHERLVFREDIINQLAAIVRQLCVSNPDVPPVEVRGALTPDGGVCTVLFPGTESFSLSQEVNIQITLALVDYVDSSIRLTAEARAGEPTTGGEPAIMFEGVLEWGRVRIALDCVICAALVDAQDFFERGGRNAAIDLRMTCGGQLG